MATFGQIAFMVLDILKEHADDAYYTEEHVLFLAKKMRALLLERKYKGSRNGVFNEMSEENRQQICLQVSPTTMLPEGCGGTWLVSSAVIPEFAPGNNPIACTGHDLLFTNVCVIPAERMKYVGYNKWLKNIIYAARSIDGHLYLRSNNPQFQFLSQVGVTGVFSDPEAAAKLSHEACMNGGVCDIMEQPFPLEAALVPSLIEMVVQELIGSRYAPEDKTNDAKDGLGEAAVTQQRSQKPAENTTYKRREEEE